MNQNTNLIQFIVIKPHPEVQVPVGTVLMGQEGFEHDSLLPCLGQSLSIKDYPDLYAVVGSKFSPPATIYGPTPNWFMRVVFRRKPKIKANPAYNPSRFSLPSFHPAG